jgi:hypothetical protein
MLGELGEPCQKVRLIQDRMPVEPLTKQQSWGRGERPFSPQKVRLSQDTMTIESPTQQQSWVRRKKASLPSPS